MARSIFLTFQDTRRWIFKPGTEFSRFSARKSHGSIENAGLHRFAFLRFLELLYPASLVPCYNAGGEEAYVMDDREFEAFLLKEVQRVSKVYYGIMTAYGFCAAASAVMAVAALFIYGRSSSGIIIKLLMATLSFAVMCFGAMSIARGNKVVIEEMAFALEDTSRRIPDDYSERAKSARYTALRNLKSTRGLIISYGIIAVMLWAAAVLFIFLSIEGTGDIDMMFLLLTVLMLAMAIPLTILSIAYMKDLPNYRKYKQLIEKNFDEAQRDSEKN